MIRLDDNGDFIPPKKEIKTDKRLGIGIIFIFMGLIFLFNNIGLIPSVMKHYIFSWQMVLIIIGLFMVGSSRNKKTGLILISIGVVFIIPDLIGFGRIGLGKLWSLAFVAIGAYLLLRHKNQEADHQDNMGIPGAPDSNIIDDVNIFGGSKKVIRSKKFKGGRVTAIFGGADYTFTSAELDNGSATIDVFVMFGGTKMIVPSDWDVVIDVVAIFGGYEDKRNMLNNIQINSGKRLIIKGLTLFGGGEIKSM